MTEAIYVSDEELQRFVDGELPESRYQEIAELLGSDPLLARAVDAYREINTMLAGLNLDVLSEPVPERLRIDAKRVTPSWWRHAAAVAALAIGLGVGWQLNAAFHPAHQGSLERLASGAVTAHEVYASEILHPVEVRADGEQHLERWLSKRLQFDIRVPDISSDGYRLLGGRLLPGDSVSPHALVMYERQDGARLSLYIARPADGEEPTALTYDSFENVGVYSWIDHELQCAVVASVDQELSRDRLHDLADKLYEQLEL